MDSSKIITPLMTLFEMTTKDKGEPTYITDLILLNIKSLLPSEGYKGVAIDYRRYAEELKLWKYYRHGENRALINILEELNSNVYWKEKDVTVYPRIMSIILTNTDYSYIKEEVIKNILFTTGNIETLIEGILLSRLFYMNLVNDDNIIEKLKEEVINLKQVEFFDAYEKHYRLPVRQYAGNYKLEFERNKIFALNTLNSAYSNKFKTLEDCIEIMYSEEEAKTIFGQSLKSYEENKVYPDKNYYYSLANYVYLLRTKKIDRESLMIDRYILPDVFSFKEGDEFYHSLLSNAKVIKKKEVNKEILIYLRVKSGNYIFKKKLNLS